MKKRQCAVALDQLAKPTFRSRYAHTPITEQSEGQMDTVASTIAPQPPLVFVDIIAV